MRFHSLVDDENNYQNMFCLSNAMFSSLLDAQTNRTTNSLASLLDGHAIALKDFHHEVMSICELDHMRRLLCPCVRPRVTNVVKHWHLKEERHLWDAQHRRAYRRGRELACVDVID
jgi:hypothetical protein